MSANYPKPLLRAPETPESAVDGADPSETERRRVERELVDRLSQVGRACAMVAHEIGNPLAAIKATLQSIEAEADAAGLGDTITALFGEVDRLDKILDEFLTFVSHRPPRKQRASLPPILARARLSAGPRLRGAEIRVSTGPVPDVNGDPDQLHRVFLNLLINAAEAAGASGQIWAQISHTSDEVTVRVEDTGPGIPRELRDRVLESFFTTKPTGVGLGLSICHRIVVDHGGSISIEDREGGRGASICVTLPVAGSE